MLHSIGTTTVTNVADRIERMVRAQTTNEAASLAVAGILLCLLIGASVGFLVGPHWLPGTRLAAIIFGWFQALHYPDPIVVSSWDTFGKSVGLTLGLLVGLLVGLGAALGVLFCTHPARG
jgi:hypothetical protein